MIAGSGGDVGLCKFDLKGNLVNKFQKVGEGPGEFVFPLALKAINNKIIVHDVNRKLLIYDKNLKFIEEHKLPLFFSEFAVNKNKEYIIPSTVFSSQKRKGVKYSYFKAYSKNIKFLRNFGDSRPTSNSIKKIIGNGIYCIAYNPIDNRIIVAFGNRYDLMVFENEKFLCEIKEDKNFYKKKIVKDVFKGKMLKFTEIKGKPIKLIIINNELFYFYRKDEFTFCDIFNLKNFKIKKRIQLKNKYVRITNINNVIFGVVQDQKSEDLDLHLFKFKIH